MDGVFSIFGSLLVLLSILGYGYFIHKKLHLSIYILPIFVIASISLLIYLSSFTGFMLYVSYMIFIGGLFCFIYALINKEVVIRLENYPDIILIIGFIVVFILFMLLISSVKMIHYDNYSHWMSVVKELLLTNQLIQADNLMIEFKNYPIGTASWIYFVCKSAGQQQWVMLFGQSLMIFASFFAMFSIIKEKKRLLLMVFLATGLVLLSYFNLTIRINNLLVDFILPSLTLASIASTTHYKNDFNRSMISNLPILSLLMIVKSTGIIYVMIAVVYLIFQQIRNLWNHALNDRFKSFMLLSIKFALWFLMMGMPFLMWQNYVATEFSGIENKFEISTDKITSIYAGKTATDVEMIVELYADTLVDVNQRATQGIIFYHILTILAVIIAKLYFKKNWKLLNVLFCLDLMLIVYFWGILAMYIFSMPLDEAIYLAGYERYAASIVILFGGALTMAATKDIENSFYYRLKDVDRVRAFKSIQTKKMYNISVTICLMVIYLVLSSELNGIMYNNHQYDESLVATIQEVVGDSWEAMDMNHYLIYASDEHQQLTNYYGQYVSRYYLRAPYVDGICQFYEDNMLNLLSQYDYLVVYESDDEILHLMKKYFNIEVTPGIYDIKELLLKRKRFM